MLGAIIIAVVIVILIPVGFLMSLSGVAAVLGQLLTSDAEKSHEGSELLETNY